MEQNTNTKPETVRIEIEVSEFTEDFIKAYSKLSNKTPEALYKKILMAGVRDIIGTIKNLPYTSLEGFIEVMESIPLENEVSFVLETLHEDKQPLS